MSTSAPTTNLDNLLTWMRASGPDAEWAELPTYGGEAIRDPGAGPVWSWDETRVLWGVCSTQLSIISREEYEDAIR